MPYSVHRIARTLLEVFECGDYEELFDEEFRVEHSYVGRPPDQGVGVGRQSVVDVVTHQTHAGPTDDRGYDVVNDLAVSRS